MHAAITGSNGQDGSYLAELLLSKGYVVTALLRDAKSDICNHHFLGIDKQLNYQVVNLADISSTRSFLQKNQPDEIYHLAGQSSVSASFVHPIQTIEYNVLSLVNLLECIREHDWGTKLYHASSSEMFGNVRQLPITLETQMRPLSPYGVSKASAFWALNSYRESFDLNVASGVLFNHESVLRPKSFFVKKVVADAVEISLGRKQFLEVGNINVSRDFGYAPDYVKAMWLILQADKPKDYIISSGKSVLLYDIIKYVFDQLNVSLESLRVKDSLVRPTDIEDIYGDNSHAKSELGWRSSKDIFQVADEMIAHELAQYGTKNEN